MQHELTVRSRQRTEVIDLTEAVTRVVADAGVASGLCHVYVPHATAAIVINENDDPNLCVDLLDALDRLVPQGQWRHDRVDGNGAAHIKAAMLGPSETIPVREARLLLGTWQAIMLVELDGPRQRRVVVTVSGA
ncbi:MAG: secondary thiamine-phosphate synthase enzyme YjbQ [Deltaproteobacteria bacterium]|nr:secondary thiamine-phosphate synthase enzyme YjbQ [Deltaproteobacteria bacterium]